MDYIVRETPVDVANIRTPSHVNSLAQEAMQTKWGIVIIEFTDSFETSLLSRSIAWSSKDKLLIGSARASNNQLAKEFGLGSQPEYPQIVVMCGGKKVDFLASKVYGGALHRKSVDSWILKNFGTFALRRETCETLSRKARGERAAKKIALKAMLHLSREELEKKRVKELRGFVEDMNINTDSLIEKVDYIDAILAQGKSRSEL
jgi:hypothetical protein